MSQFLSFTTKRLLTVFVLAMPFASATRAGRLHPRERLRPGGRV